MVRLIPLLWSKVTPGACREKLVEHLSDFFLVLGRAHSNATVKFLPEISNILCPPSLNRVQEIGACLLCETRILEQRCAGQKG